MRLPLIIAAAISLLSPGAALAASVAEWRQDIDEITWRVRTVHPDPFTKVGRDAFLAEAEAFKNALPDLSEPQRTVRAMRLMASVGDAHSIIEPNTPAFARWYPVRIVEFTDGYFVTAAHKSAPELTGARILMIAGRPVSEVADAARDLMSADNRFWRRESLYPLMNAGAMTGLGYAGADGALSVRLKLKNGRTVERVLVPQANPAPFEFFHSSFDWRFGRTEISGPPFAPSTDWVAAFDGQPSSSYRTFDPKRPIHLAHRSLAGRALPDKDAYYILINVWQDTAQETMPAFFRRVFREVDQSRPKRLILDLRYAPGGDGTNGLALLQEFLARRDNQPWRDLYILVSGRTYSASLNVLAPLLANVPATLVGEPMGGSWNLYGDYSTFPLPRTGHELRVSALRHQLGESTDIRAFIPVDVPAPFSFADYMAGRDPAVDPILAGAEMRSIVIVARSDGGTAARKVYLERKARFGAADWWAPPTEFQMLRAADQLVLDGRQDDAIETYRLSSDIHPGHWRSWVNLGHSLRKAGRNAEALVAYRRSLALNDPTNFVVDNTRALVAELEKGAGK